MFYSQLLLAKKGPLSKVWLAAHWTTRLSKQQISSTDVSGAAESLKKPTTPLSLRVSGHLLLGLSKIFQRQVQYLYIDSNDAFVKIKTAFKTGGAVLLELQMGEDAGVNINLPAIPADANAMLVLGGNYGLDAFPLPDFGAMAAGGPVPALPFGAGMEMEDEWGVIGTGGGVPGSSQSRRRTAPLDDSGMGGMYDDVEGYASDLAGGYGRRASTRSSFSDIEVARREADRRSMSVDRASMPVDEDDRASVYSDMDDSVRGRKRARSSLQPAAAGEARMTMGPGLVPGMYDLDDAERAMAAAMGLTGEDEGLAGMPLAGGLDVGGGGFDDYLGGDYGTEMAEAGVTGEETGEAAAPRLVTDADILAATAPMSAEALAAAREAKEAERKARAAARGARRDAALRALVSRPDQSTTLPSDVIRGWLADTSDITLRSAHNVEDAASTLLASAAAQRERRFHDFVTTSLRVGGGAGREVQRAWASVAATSADAAPLASSVDGTVLLPTPAPSTSEDARYFALGTGASGAAHPNIVAMLNAHAAGKAAYPKLVHAGEEEGERAEAVAASARRQRPAGDEAEGGEPSIADRLNADAGFDVDYGRDDWHLDADLAAPGVLDAEGNLVAPAAEDSLNVSATSGKLSALSGGLEAASLPGSAARSAADLDNLSVVSGATRLAGGEEEGLRTPLAGDLGESRVSTSMVEQEKWHPQTKAMLRVLAERMTGPPAGEAPQLAGRKRRARGAPAKPVYTGEYDLSDTGVGVGSAAQPLSFSELEHGASRREAAAAFFQLLVLRSWDVVHVEQEEPFEDIAVSRTDKFALAYSELLSSA